VEKPDKWLEDVAASLRALRAQAGLTGKQLADVLGWAQSKVSRIENLLQWPGEADIAAWLRACHATAGDEAGILAQLKAARVGKATSKQVSFAERGAEGQAPVQKTYSDLAQDAGLIRHFETAYVPGPLQIPDYARCVLHEIRGLHNLPVDDVDEAVAERMQRAQMLYEPSKQWEFLIAEPVLRWLICPAAVMRAQLGRLQMVIGMSRVRFGIIPMGVELATTPQNTVELYVSDAETIAVAETFAGEDWHPGNDEEHKRAVELYSRAVDRMWEDAAEGDRARDLIIRAAQALS
jgi:transcriptional regulator with XRE-family HTH domain